MQVVLIISLCHLRGLKLSKPFPSNYTKSNQTLTSSLGIQSLPTAFICSVLLLLSFSSTVIINILYKIFHKKAFLMFTPLVLFSTAIERTYFFKNLPSYCISAIAGCFYVNLSCHQNF